MTCRGFFFTSFVEKQMSSVLNPPLHCNCFMVWLDDLQTTSFCFHCCSICGLANVFLLEPFTALWTISLHHYMTYRSVLPRIHGCSLLTYKCFLSWSLCCTLNTSHCYHQMMTSRILLSIADLQILGCEAWWDTSVFCLKGKLSCKHFNVTLCR